MGEQDFRALRLSWDEKGGYTQGKYDPQRPWRATFDRLKMLSMFESDLRASLAQCHFENVCHVVLDTRLPPLLLCALKRLQRLQMRLVGKHVQLYVANILQCMYIM